MTTHVNAVERVNQYLDEQANLDTLRFITCGSVDDGKSTLIGRMLYEAQLIFEDQVASLQTDSKKMGTQGGEIDFALLVDGQTLLNVSKVSRLMLPTVFFRRIVVNLSSLIRPATNNTLVTWSREHQPLT